MRLKNTNSAKSLQKYVIIFIGRSKSWQQRHLRTTPEALAGCLAWDESFLCRMLISSNREPAERNNFRHRLKGYDIYVMLFRAGQSLPPLSEYWESYLTWAIPVLGEDENPLTSPHFCMWNFTLCDLSRRNTEGSCGESLRGLMKKSFQSWFKWYLDLQPLYTKKSPNGFITFA